MTPEMSQYLEAIGISKHFLARAKEVYDFYTPLLDEEVEDLFVSEYVDGDGARQYESLWMFTKSHVMEATLFLTQDDFDFTNIRNVVAHWKIQKENYDFMKADEKSRMKVQVTLSSKLRCDFRASKENCDYLRAIFLRHIKPNIVRSI
jgi:hypothetical protein